MSAATSTATGRRYGLARVCRAWAVPRSSVYAQRAKRAAASPAARRAPVFPSAQAPAGGVPSHRRPHEGGAAAPQRSATEAEAPARSHAQPPQAASMVSTGVADVACSEHGGILASRDGAEAAVVEAAVVEAAVVEAAVVEAAVVEAAVVPSPLMASRRGPKPAQSDAQVLDLVRQDLAHSPFAGEGHRKVHARLRRAGHRVHRRQVLRVMRAAQLLSPHRVRQGTPTVHDGTIVTDAPNVMWGTDGMRVPTVDDGWVWIFVAVEHWNGEVMGVHVTKRGDRFAALEPLRQGLEARHGALGRDVGRGLKLRLDHGTQYTAAAFQNEAKHWGLDLSWGYVAEPETNGVTERFNRTLKEQVIHGHVYRDVAALRAAVVAFVERYNDQWLLEKNGYRSPRELRVAQESMAA